MPLVIDGHNLIGKMSSISLADPNDEEKLIRLLAQHLLRSRRKVIVVFDKGGGHYPLPRPKGAKMRVIFAPPESSADAIIIDMIRRDPNPKGLTIVSSDNEIRRSARSRRARLISSEEFARQLESSGRANNRLQNDSDGLDDIDISEWLEYFQT